MRNLKSGECVVIGTMVTKRHARALWGPEWVFLEAPWSSCWLPAALWYRAGKTRRMWYSCTGDYVNKVGKWQTVCAKINKLVKFVFFLKLSHHGHLSFSAETWLGPCLSASGIVGLLENVLMQHCFPSFQFGTSVVEKHILYFSSSVKGIFTEFRRI